MVTVTSTLLLILSSLGVSDSFQIHSSTSGRRCESTLIRSMVLITVTGVKVQSRAYSE